MATRIGPVLVVVLVLTGTVAAVVHDADGRSRAVRLAPIAESGATGVARYVDCAGDDARSGTTPATAWRSLARASAAPLRPGEQVLLRRGCRWNGERLDAGWQGTPAAPVLVSAYGDGADPVVRNGKASNVRIAGAWLIVEHLDVGVDAQRFTSCGQPLGEHYGFVLVAGAHDVVLRSSRASGEEAGVHIAAGAHDNHVVDNVLVGNNMIAAFNADPEVDQGAWGLLLNGDRNEIARNRFADNRAVCTNGSYRLRSKSINIYEAAGNVIHHNRSTDRVFAELGSSDTVRTTGTVFQYNVFTSSMDESRFVTTRGAGDKRWGPVLKTTVEHNSTFQTGQGSIGVSSALGCDGTVLSTDSNIFWAEARALSADGDFPNHRDIYWSSSGRPQVTAPRVDPSSLRVDPRASSTPPPAMRACCQAVRPSTEASAPGRGRRTPTAPRSPRAARSTSAPLRGRATASPASTASPRRC